MPQPLFEFRQAGLVAPDGAVLLDEIVLRVEEVPVTVIVGPSGSGKSTLLRLCNRLEVPTSGAVWFRGDDIATVDPRVHRRRVGMVFQRPTLFPGTVLDNLRVADASLTNEGATRLLEQAALPAALAGRTADELSGGEAQRVCLARTLATRPEVLLLDEPTSALDAAARDALERLVLGRAAGGVRILWVTHDAAQSARVADAVVELAAGRVVSPRRAEDGDR